MTAVAYTARRLPFSFDTALLKRDLRSVGDDDWAPHYNERDFGGQWAGVALRSAGGSACDLNAGPAGAAQFTDTPLLARCVYYREIMAQFQCPLKSVRLLSLAPGSFIREHSDNALGFEDGEVRIHIPVQTNSGVEFYVCGERFLFEEGRCYYVNVNLPHRVNNRGTEARIHLVIDAVVNDWVRELFALGREVPRSMLPPAHFDEFSRQVFSDAPLREKLRAIPDRSRLLVAVVDEAERRGFNLNTADFESVFRSRFSVAQASDAGWIPIGATLRDSRPWVRWMYAPDYRYTEPFFGDSVKVSLRNPFTALFQRETPLVEQPGAYPAGFIFHMSRCGSTLISRSLAAAESTHVISEAPPIDAMVQTGRPEWLRWIISALGQGRKNYVIKLDAWHIRSLPLFRAAYPDVPWIFVHRDPMEVLVSQLRQPGLQGSPGMIDPAILGLRAEDVTGLTRQQWCARVLEGFMTAALQFRGSAGGMFVGYRELPGAICGRIAGHFGIELDREDGARVRAATHVNAKNPWATFESDGEAKQSESAALTPDCTLDRLKTLYQQMHF